MKAQEQIQEQRRIHLVGVTVAAVLLLTSALVLLVVQEGNATTEERAPKVTQISLVQGSDSGQDSQDSQDIEVGQLGQDDDGWADLQAAMDLSHSSPDSAVSEAGKSPSSSFAM